MQFVMAEMETEHFTFDALGWTRDEAKKTLEDALRVHAKRCNLDPEWFTDGYDITYRDVTPGCAYCDRSLLSDGTGLRWYVEETRDRERNVMHRLTIMHDDAIVEEQDFYSRDDVAAHVERVYPMAKEAGEYPL